MLGQHPQLYGVPETHLFSFEAMPQWWRFCGANHFGDGLLRTVAQLRFSSQDERTVSMARTWLWERRDRATAEVATELTILLHPLTLVEKSPTLCQQPAGLDHARRVFPGARLLHLVRHPFPYCQSVVTTLRAFTKHAGSSVIFPTFAGLFDFGTDPPTLDPQGHWYQAHTNILEFLREIPATQQRRVLGEELLADPDHHLRELASWLGLRTSDAAIQQMKHPERWPFASLGPANARWGGDPKFLGQPTLRTEQDGSPRLDVALPWRSDGAGFRPQVQLLARQLGYR
jgi:hypothetical protein